MDNYYSLSELKDGVYRISCPENVFCELLVGQERALLIDTGYGFRDLKGFIRSITDKPLTVVNTHGHCDHTGGNDQFSDEEIYISREDMDLMQRHNTAAFREKSARLAEQTLDYATGKFCNILPENFDVSAYAGQEDFYSDASHFRMLEDGMVFDLGGKTMRAIATPGHTRGGISFLYEEVNWLYAGDAANIFLWLFGEDATDRATHIATLDKLIALNPQCVFGGHAPEPYHAEDLYMFWRAAVEADYDQGIPFQTPILEECTDARICTLGNNREINPGDPGFYAIVLDSARK